MANLGTTKALARVLLGVALFAGVAACGDDDDDATASGGDQVENETAGDNTLTITEREYEFDVEGDVVAGDLSIAVENTGVELHEIGMARLADGKSVDDLRTAIAEAGDDPESAFDAGITEEDATIDDLGGIQLPGTAYTISGSGIEAGDYVLLCFLPNAEGEEHFNLGMLTGFTIGEGDVSVVTDADVTYTATDDAIEGPDDVDAGTTTIEVVNESSVNREVTLLKIKDGKTIEDVLAWFESADEGPPDPATSPLEFLAFVFDAKQDRSITVELTPGQWAIQSPDPEAPFEGPPTEDPHAILITVA